MNAPEIMLAAATSAPIMVSRVDSFTNIKELVGLDSVTIQNRILKLNF